MKSNFRLYYPFRGEPLPSVRSMLSSKRSQREWAARLRHRNYAIGYSFALRFWKQSPCQEHWGWTCEGPTPRPERMMRTKRRNLARERVDAQHIPF